MSWFTNFLQSIFKTADISTIQPTSSIKVDNNYVYTIISTKFTNKYAFDKAHVYLSDSAYYLCSKADIETFLAQDATNKQNFVAETFDCDDFSYRLMGQLSIPSWSAIAFGIVWTNTHALNCFIDDTGKFYFVEPQSGKLQEDLESWQGNEVLFILM